MKSNLKLERRLRQVSLAPRTVWGITYMRTKKGVVYYEPPTTNEMYFDRDQALKDCIEDDIVVEMELRVKKVKSPKTGRL